MQRVNPEAAWKSVARRWLPPAVFDLGRRCGGLHWTGHYATWQDARAVSRGYDEPTIIEKVRLATHKLRRGEVLGERDSVVFLEPAYSWPVVAGVMLAAARCGRLSVLDFGGALGTTYYQVRPFLAGLRDVRWSVVEQEYFARIGREEFESEQLKFFSDFSLAVPACAPDCVLFSSVLQYVPDPYGVFRSAVEAGPEVVIVDRTPFLSGGEEHWAVQFTPSWIYRASYPCFLFNRQKLMHSVGPGYGIVADFESPDRAPPSCRFRGIIFAKC